MNLQNILTRLQLLGVEGIALSQVIEQQLDIAEEFENLLRQAEPIYPHLVAKARNRFFWEEAAWTEAEFEERKQVVQELIDLHFLQLNPYLSPNISLKFPLEIDPDSMNFDQIQQMERRNYYLLARCGDGGAMLELLDDTLRFETHWFFKNAFHGWQCHAEENPEAGFLLDRVTTILREAFNKNIPVPNTEIWVTRGMYRALEKSESAPKSKEQRYRDIANLFSLHLSRKTSASAVKKRIIRDMPHILFRNLEQKPFDYLKGQLSTSICLYHLETESQIRFVDGGFEPDLGELSN